MGECTIKLIIPCDGDDILNIKLKKDEILNRSNFLSPLFGYCSLNSVFEKFNIKDFFATCGFSNQRVYQSLNLEHFKPVEYFYPYGIILEAKIELENINIWINKFNNFFRIRNVTCSNLGDKKEWDIKGYPIILLEANNYSENDIEYLKEKLDISYTNEILPKYNMIISNPIIILSQVDRMPLSLYENILDVLKVVCAIYFIARDVKMELSKKMEQLEKNTSNKNIKKINITYKEDKKEERDEDSLLKIQKKCALIKELSSNIIFLTNQQKRVYELIIEEFKIYDILNQVDAVSNIISTCIEINENYVSKKIEKKAYTMDKTVFITGYVGLILAVFNFFPLNLQNLCWISIPDDFNWIKVFIYGFIIVVSMGGCIILVKFYDYLLKNEEIYEKLKQYMWKTSVVIVVFLLVYMFTYRMLGY